MLNLIVAPLTECEKGENYCKRIVSYLKQQKVEYAVYFSPELKTIEQNAETLTKEGETDFVLIGNDAVLHAFLNSVKDITKVKLGLVPVGDADFAQYLGINSNPLLAIQDILSGNQVDIDYIKLGNTIVINNIVLGASAEIYELYSQRKLKNALTRKMLRSKYGNTFSGINLTIEYKEEDGKIVTLEENIYELCVANGGKSKGKNISPLSNVKDGFFNLSYAKVSAIEERKKYLIQFENGNQIYDDRTQQKWLTNLKLTTNDGKIKAMVDGKIVLLENLNLTLICGGLKLLKAKV